MVSPPDHIRQRAREEEAHDLNAGRDTDADGYPIDDETASHEPAITPDQTADATNVTALHDLVRELFDVLTSEFDPGFEGPYIAAYIAPGTAAHRCAQALDQAWRLPKDDEP